MKIHKLQSMLIIMILIFSLFSANFSSLIVEDTSKTPIELSMEKEIPETEKKNDKATIPVLLSMLHSQSTLQNSSIVENHYTYLDSNQLLRPPIFL